MLLEIHAHSSRHSRCSRADPVALIRQAVRKHLQGIVITDHRYLWPEEELKTLREEAEVGDNFLILSGQEVETDIGHVLVYGAPGPITEKISLKELREELPGAALVWAHPFRGSVPGAEKLLNPYLDAVEIFSLNHTPRKNCLGLSLWHEHKFTAVSGSDAHEAARAAALPTQFDHPVGSLAEMIEEIKAGRCRPFFKEIPKAGGNIMVTEITLGTKGDDESRRRVIVKKIGQKKKWKRIRESLEIVTSLREQGFGEGPFRVPGIIESDPEDLLVIEEGQRGKLLFDLMQYVNPAIGRQYCQLTARWLARLHKLGLRIGEMTRTIKKERRRFESYLGSFQRAGSPHLEAVRGLIEFVAAREEEMFEKEADGFVQVHGDYHPKNIIIGQDRMQDISTLFISVIDFDSSLIFSPAFDVGCFLSQFAYQFRGFPDVRKEYLDNDFIRAYREERKSVGDDFENSVAFFRIRANLSIASFLIKMGKGDSDELRRVVEESRALAAVPEMRRSGS